MLYDNVTIYPASNYGREQHFVLAVAGLCYNSTMSDTANLADEINKRLPAEPVDFMRQAGQLAMRRQQSLYLVGGAVRDLLLGKPNLDLDLVTDRDAIGLAQELGSITRAKITTHSRFNTAKLRWDKWSVDIATVRSETYEKPGALPKVGPGTLETDLFRRDFTINALAVELTASHYGQLVDLYDGRGDLGRKLIRVLHEKSFVDDATRMWRAIRYEQRLGFHLESETRSLLRRDLPMLNTISGDRIRHELELALKEERPEKVLRRAGELGILSGVHPSLRGDAWLARKFGQARKVKTDGPLTAVYLALLGYRSSEDEIAQMIDYLRLPRAAAQALRDTIGLKGELDTLAEREVTPSRIYSLVKDYCPTAITTNRIAADPPPVRRRLILYLERLRYVKPALTGDDLIGMGIPTGPGMKEILQELLEARLDGKVRTREGEVGMVRELNPH